MNVVYCSSEVVPYAKTGGLADVAGALPVALAARGHNVAVVMPKYASVEKSGAKLLQHKNGYYYTKPADNVTVYFIDNDSYYDRPELYGDKKGDYPDNVDRFTFYSRQTLALLQDIKFKPDVINCNDWQSALIPVLLKTQLRKEPFFAKTKTALTIHNLAYQGLFPAEQYSRIGLDTSLMDMNGFEFYGKVNFLKAGILFADRVTTVSNGYAKEITEKEFGCGLEGVLMQRKKDLNGIVNGLDYTLWDPKTDSHLFASYDASDLTGKQKNKAELQKLCGLDVNPKVPLFGFVGRLAEQKGVDLIVALLEAIPSLDIQAVILGTGDARYHEMLEKIAKQNPKRFNVNLRFDNTFAHRIYAASDIFLMPSRYEPCGLGQMISFKYGTIPLVAKTGGLADTVKNYSAKTKKGDGFVFSTYGKEPFFGAVKNALKLFTNKAEWQALQKKVMGYCFSWEESAKKYEKLYKGMK